VGFPTSLNSSARLSVAANGELRVGFYMGALRDDCSVSGQPTVRTVVEPANGRIAYRHGSDVPYLRAAPGTPRAKCVGRSYPGTIVTYRPTAGFTGEDTFVIDAIWPAGTSAQRSITVQVR
jgi:hypothetical protein